MHLFYQFFDRVFDLFILLFLSLIGATVFRELLGGVVGIIIIFLIVISLFLILLASAKIRVGIGRRLGAILLPVKAKESSRNSSLMQRLGKLSLSRFAMLSAVLLSLIAYAIAFFRYYLLILSLNLSIPLWPFLGCVTIASIIIILPISFSGIGTRDAVLIYLFSYLGLAQETAISFSLLFLVMVLSNMIVGLFSWLKLSI